MLGKLARKLRILGFDTLYESSIEEEEVLEKAKGRILLTRDKELYRRAVSRGMKAFYVKSDLWRSQLRELMLEFPLEREMKPFTRCPVCNSELVEVDREEVREEVPEYVYKSVDEFKKCPVCGRIYWRGTHVDWIARDMEKLVGEWRTV